ncbi:MAG: YceI family protein [Gammaproteobacteria bacterium]|nr:YceI family protein [Gammaproteobacteria bacterium]
MSERGVRRWTIAAVLLLTACAPTQRAPSLAPAARPEGFPTQQYLEAAARGEAVYMLEPGNSLAVATVRRSGPLAKLGHDHVVASHALNGYVRPAAGVGDLYVPLADLDVDAAELRRDAGLDTTPSAADIAGTAKNLQEKVLATDRHPYAIVHFERRAADTLQLTMILNGVAHEYTVAARIDVAAEELAAEGRFEVKQTDFGITPFAILGGGLRVEDAIAMRFVVKAHRIAE